MSSALNVSNFRRRRKLNLIKVCGGKCALCGYDKIPDALDFHHIVLEDKAYGISSGGICHDLEKDLTEVQKCILVCANCHREIHAGFYSEEDLWEKQRYDEELANQLREEKKEKLSKTLYYCTNCGKQLFGKTVTNLCQQCYKQTTRATKRLNREELKQLIRKYPFTEIGSQFGVTDNAVRKWCDAENLPRTKREINKITDEEWSKI